MPLPPRGRGRPPASHEKVPDPPRRWGSWAVILTFVLAVIVGSITWVTISRDLVKGYEYPSAPSTWDGASVARFVPTPAPDAVLLNFAEFVDLAEGPFGAVVQGWEAEPECKIPAPDNNRLYPVCTFKGSGLVMRVKGYASGKLESIKFTFDRYHMATATQLFNRIVWETGFEKQGEAARKLVDKELDETTDLYAADTVDRIYVQAYFSDYLRDLVIKFSE